VSEIFQPDTSGIVFMPGVYSSQGHGVFRSTDYGITWTHVGLMQPERVVYATPKHFYAAAGGAAGPNAPVGPNLQMAPVPGTGTWTAGTTPPEMYQGPAQASVSIVGDKSVILLANYNAGMWRYVESD
jgi:hypothetical protein